MLDEDNVARHRTDARCVRDRLHRLASRLPPHGPARPSELTICLTRQDVRQGAALFVGMAAAAVARQLEAEGDPEAADDMRWFHEGMAGTLRAATPSLRPFARDAGRAPGVAFDDEKARPVTVQEWTSRESRWIVAGKRLGAHASRLRYQRHDQHAALAWWGCFSRGATPWVCQQADWRFRWTPDGLRRLRFMVDCWDAYSRCDFTPADLRIGLADMPLAGMPPA